MENDFPSSPLTHAHKHRDRWKTHEEKTQNFTNNRSSEKMENSENILCLYGDNKQTNKDLGFKHRENFKILIDHLFTRIFQSEE